MSFVALRNRSYGLEPLRDPTAATPALTDRQLTVIRRKAMGLPNKTVAHDLSLDIHTIKHHASVAYDKLGVTCLVDALRALGWLVVPE